MPQFSELEQVPPNIEEKFNKLQSLITISSSLNTNLNIHQLLPIIMLNAKDLLAAEASSLFLIDEVDDYLYCEVALGDKGEIIQKYIRLEMGTGIVGWVAQNKRSVLLQNAYEDQRFDPSWDKKTGFTTRSLICVPLFLKSRLIGTLEVLNKNHNQTFDENDLQLLTYLADMAAIAIENASLTENLKKRITELALLYDFEKKLSKNLNSHQLGSWLLDRCLKELNARTGSILIWDESLKVLRILHSRGIPAEEIASIQIQKGWGIAGWVAEHKQALLIPNIDHHSQFQASHRLKYEDESLISVPLIYQEKLVGVFNINNKKDGFAFNHNDLRLAKSIAERLAMALSNARRLENYQISSAENKRAKKMMEKIISPQPPRLNRLDIATRYFPFMAVGGDFFEFFEINENKLGVLIIDISGHGLSASLLAVMAHTVIQSFDMEILRNPSEFLIQLNQSLFDKMAGNFLTAFYAVIDHKRGRFKYAKAGHPEPILLRKHQKPLLLRAAGKILGALPDILYEERSIDFGQDDYLIIYTDGLIEATNPDTGAVYEQENLLEFFQQHPEMDCNQLSDKIIADVFDFTRVEKFSDDLTLILIKMK